MLRRKRRLALLLLSMLIANVALVAVGTEAHASDFWRRVSNRGDGKCLDLAQEDFGNPNPKIQIWSCSSADGQLGEGWEQQWRVKTVATNLYSIQNKIVGKCLTTHDWPFPTNVTGGQCGSTLSDYWNVIYENTTAGGWYQVLRNSYSGLCLTVPGDGNGTAIRQSDCDYSFTSGSQQWLLGENLPFAGGVSVPNVIAYDMQDAANLIGSAGFGVQTQYVEDCVDPWLVHSQFPNAGDMMSPGGSVNIVVGTCSGGGGGGGDDGGGGQPQ